MAQHRLWDTLRVEISLDCQIAQREDNMSLKENQRQPNTHSGIISELRIIRVNNFEGLENMWLGTIQEWKIIAKGINTKKN